MSEITMADVIVKTVNSINPHAYLVSAAIKMCCRDSYGPFREVPNRKKVDKLMKKYTHLAITSFCPYSGTYFMYVKAGSRRCFIILHSKSGEASYYTSLINVASLHFEGLGDAAESYFESVKLEKLLNKEVKKCTPRNNVRGSL